jgi:hypothetical protein
MRLRLALAGAVAVLVVIAAAAGLVSISALGVWVAALLTLAIFSFLYRDNPVYKLAEHIFIGISAGYFVALEYHNVFIPNLWNPLVAGLRQIEVHRLAFPNMLLLIPFGLGILLFTRFHPRIAWLSRWSMAAMIGAYSGLAIIGALQGDLVAQIRANMMPLYSTGAVSALRAAGGVDLFFGVLAVLSNPLIITGLICTLIYFFFSREHRSGLGAASKLGVWFLMISFGASFGYTVMSRVSLLIGRLHFLLSDWLGVIP